MFGNQVYIILSNTTVPSLVDRGRLSLPLRIGVASTKAQAVYSTADLGTFAQGTLADTSIVRTQKRELVDTRAEL